MRRFVRLALVFVGAGVLVCPAESAERAFARVTPAAVGVPAAAVEAFLDRVDTPACAMRSFLFLRHGRVVAEGHWAPFASDTPQALNEASGGLVAMATAMAVDEGRLTLDDHVGWALPGSVSDTTDERLRDLRVRDLLTMRSGQQEDAFAAMCAGDPLRAYLATPMVTVAGRNFRYFRANDAMLVQILAKATSERSLGGYLGGRLFGPLDIRSAHCNGHFANGTVLGSGGLALTAEDFTKLAQLLLAGGRWNGRQVLPSWFVPQATTLQAPYGKVSDPVLRHQVGFDGLFRKAPGADEWRSGYGYGLWLGSDSSYRLSGAYGQLAVVWPQHDLVFVAFAAAEAANATILEAVRKAVLPQLATAALPADAAAERELAARCARLAVPHPTPRAKPTAEALARAAAGCTFATNVLGISRLKYEESKAMLKFENVFDIQELPVKADGAWTPGVIQLEDAKSVGDPLEAVPGGELSVAASGAWQSPTTFAVRVVFQSVPLTLDFTLDCAREPMAFACTASTMKRYEFATAK